MPFERATERGGGGEVEGISTADSVTKDWQEGVKGLLTTDDIATKLKEGVTGGPNGRQ